MSLNFQSLVVDFDPHKIGFQMVTVATFQMTETK